MKNQYHTSVESLLSQFNTNIIIKYKKLKFIGIGEKDVYNITAPFTISNKTYIAARVESRNSETDSKVLFFLKQDNDKWILDNKASAFDLQDPSISKIDGKIILSGVRVFSNTDNKALQYKTIFFEGNTIYDLKEITHGPLNMKDIRLIQLSNKHIGIFTRPQGLIGGRGRIGFMQVNTIEDFKALQDKDYLKTPLINNNLPDDEWIGTNSIHVLTNNLLGILGHVACFSNNGEKNYYPITFIFNTQSNQASKMKIITRRIDLPKGESKRAELKNILFPGGLIRNTNKTAKLYLGVSDIEAYEVTIKDPFIS